MSATHADVDVSEAFLRHLYVDAQGWVSLFAINRTTGKRSVVWRPVERLSELAASAQSLAETSCVWFGAATRAEELGSRRGEADACTAITCLWADIDIAGPNHAASNLPPDRAAALELIADFPIPPSVVVDTGGGLQPYWLLHEPLDAVDAAALLVRWGATWAELGRRRHWHVDNVFDLARVLRLPGTFNRKQTDPVPVVLVDAHWDRRYSPDDLEQFTIDPPAPTAAQPNQPRVPYIGPERPGDAFNASVDPGGLLESFGWEFDNDAGGDRHYRAPHHRGERGITGATVYLDGHTTIWSNTVAQATGCAVRRPYDAFGLYVWMQHHGDWNKATEALRSAGYGTPDVDLRSLIGSTPEGSTEALPPDSDWSSVDLAEIARAIRAGTHQPIEPTVLDVAGGIPLLYPGRVNSLFGESGGGKTWVALAAAAERLRAGERVLMIDYEDAAGGIAERLVFLGLTDDEIALLDYRNPSTALSVGVAEIETQAVGCSLVILDSTGEAMASGGINPNADEEVARWFTIARRLCRLPDHPALVVLDHIPKDKDAPSLYGIGSQRKRAAITGASYRVDTIKEPAKGRDGKLKLTVAKDRPGNRAKGTTAAIVDIVSGDAGAVSITLSAPRVGATEDGESTFRPTVYMERVSRWLELRPGSVGHEIHTGVKGKRAFIDDALAVLIDEGCVAVDPGQRGAKHHRVVRQYRESDDPKAVDNSLDSMVDTTSAHLGPTSAPPRPHLGQTPQNDLGPCPPPPTGQGRGRGDGEEGRPQPETGAEVNNPLSILDGIKP